MLAAVLRDFDHLVLEDVPVLNPGPDEVVVRIRSCGFCDTDYKAIKGIRRNVTFPAIVGHEPAGVVYCVGDAVEHFREGDEVVCSPRVTAVCAGTVGSEKHITASTRLPPVVMGRTKCGRGRLPST